MLVKDLIAFLDEKYPFSHAAPFDNGKIGLQFGDKESQVTKVKVCLDVTMDVILEAIADKCEVIISHHPLLFYPLLNLDYQTPIGKKLLMIFHNRLNIISLHTNYDVGNEGMNEHLAKTLGLSNISLTADEVGQNTYIRYGNTKATPFKEYIKHIKEQFGYKMVKTVGDLHKSIARVAVIGGSGDSFLHEAYNLNCDLLITGEIKHHTALEAKELGMALIELNHAVEACFTSKMVAILRNNIPNVIFTETSTKQDPFEIN